MPESGDNGVTVQVQWLRKDIDDLRNICDRRDVAASVRDADQDKAIRALELQMNLIADNTGFIRKCLVAVVVLVLTAVGTNILKMAVPSVPDIRDMVPALPRPAAGSPPTTHKDTP